jgi:hypothetical protein
MSPNIVTVGLETSEIYIKHEKRPDFDKIVQPWKLAASLSFVSWSMKISYLFHGQVANFHGP